MQLYTLLAGKSKKRMKPIMIDEKSKCENYKKARIASKCKEIHHSIEINTDKDAVVWRKKSCTIGGNKCDIVPRIGKNGKTRLNGYIGKHGFEQHT